MCSQIQCPPFMQAATEATAAAQPAAAAILRQPSLVARQAALFTAPAAEASLQSPSPRRTLFGQHSLGSAADRAAAAQPLLRGLSRSNILAEAKWAPAATVGRSSM